MYKTLHGMTLEYLGPSSVLRDDVTTYRLRDDINKLTLPQSRTDYLKKSFFVQRSRVVEQLVIQFATSNIPK